MAHEGNLPWKLEEEILSRVPLKSLVCFSTVSKRWNALLNDKGFIKNHKSTFRFILRTYSYTYLVSIDPEIVTRCIKGGFSQTLLRIDGIGYDSRRVGQRVYKAIASDWKQLDLDRSNYNTRWKVLDIALEAWKIHDIVYDLKHPEKEDDTLLTRFGVSLKGNLYWIAFHGKKDPIYGVITFDFSTDRFDAFCDLPCGRNHPLDALALGVFKGNRFSLLKQCHITKKIEIWVTKNKINGEDVVWMSLMTCSIPNFPSLLLNKFQCQPSYFVEDKKLIVCFCDVSGYAWIYVVGDNNKLISKTRLDGAVGPYWSFHCTYLPSLVPVPRAQREEAGL